MAEGGFTRTFNILGNDELAPLFANGFNAAHIKFRVMPENAWHSSFRHWRRERSCGLKFAASRK
jgi:hypothetical protein